MSTVKLTISVPQDLWNKAQALAGDISSSPSAVIQLALYDFTEGVEVVQRVVCRRKAHDIKCRHLDHD